MPPKWTPLFLCFAAYSLLCPVSYAQTVDPLYGQTYDWVDGVLTPGLNFLPRQVRELMVYEEPWLGRAPGPITWRAEFDDRRFERRAADIFAIRQEQLSRYRVAGLGDVFLRTNDDLNADFFDIKSFYEHHAIRGEEQSYQFRLRGRIDLPDPNEGGLMFYYRHRERNDLFESEQTKWAGAQNMPDGPGTAFIHQHELRYSPEDEIMDEFGFMFRWLPSPNTRLMFGGTYREQTDHLREQRLEYDTRSGTAELPGQPRSRGYHYNPATDVVVDGIVREGQLSAVDLGRIERQLKDEVEQKRRMTGYMELRHEVSEDLWFDVLGEYAFRQNREPDRFDVEYAERAAAMFGYRIENGQPVFNSNPLPLDTFGLRKAELEDNLKERDFAHIRGSVSWRPARTHLIEAGAFALRHTDYQDINYQRYEPLNGLDADGFLGVAGPRVGDVFGQTFGPGIDPEAARQIFASRLAGLNLMRAETAFKNVAEDFDMSRRIFGGWLLWRYDAAHWRLHAGGRYESALTEGTAFDAQWDGTENFGLIILPRTPGNSRRTSSSKTETDLLPTVLVEYQPRKDFHFSANLRQTLQRPELEESAPMRKFNEDGGVAPFALLGNPDLDSSRQTQLVLAANHAFAAGSMLRLSAEAWHMDAPLTQAGWFQADSLNDPAITAPALRNWRFQQTLNADEGELFRLAVHYAQTFHFLPHPLDQIGAFLNYDHTESSQTLTVGGNERRTPVSYTPRHRGSGGFFFRNNRFEAVLSANFYDRYLTSVGQFENGLSGTGDLWVDRRVQLNAYASLRLRKDLEIYMQAFNLTDTEVRMYEGVSDRQILRQRTGPVFRFGLHFVF